LTGKQEHHRHPVGDTLGQEADALINPDEAVEIPPADQMSLKRRLREPKTILSIVVPLVIVIIAGFLNRQYLADIPKDIASANPWLILLAFLIYYAGFPLRGWRWTKLLRGAGYKVKIKDGTEILFLPGWSTASCPPSWVTCIEPTFSS
jgi:hypothetical protein